MGTAKKGSGGIKGFFLYNVEKLILLVSLVLLGLFFYMGMSSEKFDKTPDQLVRESNRATSYIESDQAWTKIASFRRGDVAVIDRVKLADAPVDPSPYKIDGFSIVPKALGLRLDPPLPVVQDIEAHVLRASVIVQNTQRTTEDSILILPLAMMKQDPDAMKGRGMIDEMDEMEEMDNFGGRPSRGRTNRNKRTVQKDPQMEAEVDGGSGLPGVQIAMQGGVRPDSLGNGNNMALNRNVVVVNALVDHKTLWKQHEITLGSTLGYYPARDLPSYEFLQVERREIKSGKPGEWRDISAFVNFDQADLYPANFNSAPEVVPPGNYDTVITNAIPPILGVDYTRQVVHSKLTKRVFKVPEDEDTGLATSELLGGKEQLRDDDEVMTNIDGTGIRRQKRGITGNSGRNGRGMGGGGMRESQMSRSGTGMRNNGEGRSSSDLTEYLELANPTLEPISDFKQVRFFDMSVPPTRTAVYEYRLRLWVSDPNNFDEAKGDTNFAQFDGAMGGMDDEMGMGGRRGMKKGKDEKKVFEKTEINFTMQDQSVRNRIKQAREVGEFGAKEYFVSELYEGDNEPTEVMVPKGEEYLRFTRPTKWTEAVKVTVSGPSVDFFAQTITEPRKAKVGSVEFPVEETKAEIITAIEDPDFQGAKIAAKRLFSTGDVLNFSESVTVMHPVTQSVHFIENFDIRSNSVLIDIMGGERLDIAGTDELEYVLPGETLVMNSNGKFVISNDMEDIAEGRHALRLPDETATIGGKKAARRRQELEKERMKSIGSGGR